MKWIAIIFLIGGIGLGIFCEGDKNNSNGLAESKIQINNAFLRVEIADTDEERMRGLSGRGSLEGGLLFVFEREGNYGFWMKDMNFPIDIAWIDANKKIVLIEKDISPDSYPTVFGTSTIAQYVLETNSGFFESSQIHVGDLVQTNAH